MLFSQVCAILFVWRGLVFESSFSSKSGYHPPPDSVVLLLLEMPPRVASKFPPLHRQIVMPALTQNTHSTMARAGPVYCYFRHEPRKVVGRPLTPHSPHPRHSPHPQKNEVHTQLSPLFALRIAPKRKSRIPPPSSDQSTLCVNASQACFVVAIPGVVPQGSGKTLRRMDCLITFAVSQTAGITIVIPEAHTYPPTLLYPVETFPPTLIHHP
jgi:hypothetical protein